MLTAVAIDDDYNIYIISELLPKKSLDDYIRENKGVMTLSQKMSIALEISTAVYYLHTLNPPIIHRDIKPKNIFISNFLSAKLGDFGFFY